MIGKYSKRSRSDEVFFDEFNNIWERLEGDLLQADIEEDDILKKIRTFRSTLSRCNKFVEDRIKEN